ncbi:MAG: STAS domain-containing protein [Betaproteobacteria bacterium]|nr:STAS domain-containing protein [Betaproteobacteria bacterium]
MAKTKGSEPAKTLKLARDLRIASAASAYAMLKEATKSPATSVTLDGREVEKVDAAGLQAVLAGQRVLAAAGKSVSWAGVSASMRAAADLLGLSGAMGVP